MRERKAHIGEHVGLGFVEQRSQLWHLGADLVGDQVSVIANDKRSRCRHCWLAALASFCAKAVAMKAEITRRPCLPACARTFLMRHALGLDPGVTRQRCQVVLSTLETAALD